MRTSSPACLGKASSIVRSAVPDSPTPLRACSWVSVPEAVPIMKATATNASHPQIAALRCWALQRPALAARFIDCRGGAGASFPPASPPVVLGSSWMTRDFMLLRSCLGDRSSLSPSDPAREGGELADRGAGFLVSSPARASGAEKEQHGQDPPRFASGRGEVELAEDARHVLLDRPNRDHQLVGAPLG